MKRVPERSPVIYVSAVVFTDPAGRVLVVRKRGTSTFMLPGGKAEPGESALEAAIRESAEEVGIAVDAAAVEFLGHFRSATANEPDHLLDSHVYRVRGDIDADEVLRGIPESEIEEVRWIDMRTDVDGLALAPLLTECVWPILAGRGR